MVIKNPPKISPGLIFGGGGLIIGMIFVLRIRGAYFRGGGLIFGGGGLLSGFYGISVSLSSSANDLSDNILSSLPAELFTGSGVPFTPMFHNCSNIHFHIHTEKYRYQQ